MDVLRKNVYAQLGAAMMGFIWALLASVIYKDSPDRAFYVLWGVFGGLLGVASCYLSGVYHDKLNAKLRVMENEERREKEKEEKRARKSKTH
jgi:hypothetical protein